MPTATEPQLLTSHGWIFRLRGAQTKPGRLLILIHGWMGDENSMWVLARNLSPNYEIIAPRGHFPVAKGGYSWREIRSGTWGMSSLDDLRPAAEALLAFVENYSISGGIDDGQFDLMGFSQGAAMVYTLALLCPERIRRMAVLSGLIPVDGARRAATLLRMAGAKITYCESDAGHKVSKECLTEMEVFLGES